MFDRIRRLFAREVNFKIDMTGDPADFAMRASLGVRLPQDVHDAIGMVALPAGFFVRHRPDDDDHPAGAATSVYVFSPTKSVRLGVPYGATKWTIADAILDVVEALDPFEPDEPVALPFPAPVGA